ncbi:hypothetical protein J6590_046917 [Homalodisca vitripennis]|nr:hypothetical protein J6590_046917 [Homalodisca vitripennis]
MSFVYHKYSTGPSTDPCGTPVVMGPRGRRGLFHSDKERSVCHSSSIPEGSRSCHCPVLRPGPALGCNFCWNTIDAHGRILRRKTKYHCPECQTNLCIVPCFQILRHIKKTETRDPEPPERKIVQWREDVLRDNARPHVSRQTQEQLTKFGWTIVPPSPLQPRPSPK